MESVLWVLHQNDYVWCEVDDSGWMEFVLALTTGDLEHLKTRGKETFGARPWSWIEEHKSALALVNPDLPANVQREIIQLFYENEPRIFSPDSVLFDRLTFQKPWIVIRHGAFLKSLGVDYSTHLSRGWPFCFSGVYWMNGQLGRVMVNREQVSCAMTLVRLGGRVYDNIPHRAPYFHFLHAETMGKMLWEEIRGNRLHWYYLARLATSEKHDVDLRCFLQPEHDEGENIKFPYE